MTGKLGGRATPAATRVRAVSILLTGRPGQSLYVTLR